MCVCVCVYTQASKLGYNDFKRVFVIVYICLAQGVALLGGVGGVGVTL